MRTLRISPQAEADLGEAFHWYQAQAPALGNRLFEEVGRLFDQLTERPHSFPIVHKTVRRALLRRFPYCIYFLSSPDEVIVIAVLHGRRNPALLRRRAKSPGK